MQVINLNTVNNKPKPKAIITVIIPSKKKQAVSKIERVISKSDQRPSKPERERSSQKSTITSHKQELLNRLIEEIRDVKTEREQLSSTIAPFILKKQESATLEELMIRPSKDLANLYEAIDAKTREISKLTKDIEYVELYGQLPKQEKATEEPTDKFALRDICRKLTDKRSKLTRKIQNGENNPKVKATKLNEWRLSLAEADVKYQHYDELRRKADVK